MVVSELQNMHEFLLVAILEESSFFIALLWFVVTAFLHTLFAPKNMIMGFYVGYFVAIAAYPKYHRYIFTVLKRYRYVLVFQR